MATLRRIIAAFLALFLYAPSGEIASYAPMAETEVRLQFTVFSDVHLEGNNKARHKRLGEGLRDLAAAERQSDALVLLGDNTMNGQAVETSMLYGLLRKYNPVSTVLMAAGNHDICPGEHNTGDYEDLKTRFINYNNAFLEHKIENLYHGETVNGYRFLVLASDKDAGVTQYLSDAQLAWLDGELAAAAESGKPVFLFSHWPVNEVFAEVWPEGHVGTQSDALQALLQKYDNRIFFFTGHLHMGVRADGYGVADAGNITYINAPAFGADSENGDADVTEPGMGLQVEVSDAQVVVSVRNFETHTQTPYIYRFSLAE